ncbi:MAG: efflux RND transporter periplasmic adaptor subunit [Candidatus Peribacteraceae bacterium]|nr:efflux RND transporter periplasmic adaptor subunit [Candidatus Peribacteraceae bacterium]
MKAFFVLIVARVKQVYRYLRGHLKSTIAVIVLLLVGWAVYAVTRPVQPVYVTDTARKGDLRQAVEAVGTVVSEKDLQLQFSSIDVVTQVLVKEGDTVKAGQRLAALRSGTLSAGIASASASVQSAQAALTALEQGSRPEDIAIAEAGVNNKRASLQVAEQTVTSAEANLKIADSQLQTLKNEVDINLAGQVSAVGSTISQQLATSKTVVLAIRGVYSANDVSDAVTKSQNTSYETLVLNMRTLEADITTAQNVGAVQNYQDALLKLTRARTLVSQTTDVANRAYDIMASLPLTEYFTNTSRETNKSTIATQKSLAQTAFTTIDTAIKSLQDASAGYDSKIAAQQAQIVSLTGTRDRAKADIVTYQTLLAIEEAQLALKKAPARQTDIDAARARVRQAQADLARAGAQFRDTVLTSPVDGIITQVNVKVGEIRPSAEPSITMLGSSPYRVEMFVSEIDIPKVLLTQTGSIELDAFPGVEYDLRVGEIDPASTAVDGVTKYRVKLDFVYLHDNLKIGMTGDAEILTGIRHDVVSVQQRAILERDDGTQYVRIQNSDGTTEERTVTTGMEGSAGDIEVTGVEEGETVIVLIKE